MRILSQLMGFKPFYRDALFPQLIKYLTFDNGFDARVPVTFGHPESLRYRPEDPQAKPTAPVAKHVQPQCGLIAHVAA